jgi:hypothetical protein
VLGGFLFKDYVLSTVVVVVLLAVDFWTCRVSPDFYPYASTQTHGDQNVSGRRLVGLRYWNQARLAYCSDSSSAYILNRWMMMARATGCSRAET